MLKTKFASDIYERRKISTNRLWKDTRSRTIYRLMRNTRGKSSSGYVLLREFKGVKDPDQNITLWRIKRSSTFRFTLKSSINIINSTKRLILIVKHYTKPTMFVYMVKYPIIDDLHICQKYWVDYRLHSLEVQEWGLIKGPKQWVDWKLSSLGNYMNEALFGGHTYKASLNVSRFGAEETTTYTRWYVLSRLMLE